MMKFKCPNCGNPFRVPESAAGQKGNCKKCGQTVRIPDVEKEAIPVVEETSETKNPDILDGQLSIMVPTAIMILFGILIFGFLIYGIKGPSAETEPPFTVEAIDVGNTTDTSYDGAEKSVIPKIDSKEMSSFGVFRGEIFESAYRVANEYSPGGNIKLGDELDIIEFKIEGEKEDAVFKTLKFVLDLQTDLNELEIAKNVTEGVSSKFRDMSSKDKSDLQLIKPASYNQMSEISKIHNSGGVAVKSILIPDLEKYTKLLLDNNLISIQESNGITWIEYEPSKTKLLIAEQATLKTIGHMINNNGNVPDGE
jgi:DNA-directed RNA polymerase subunit RPC12/RpoP